MLKILQNSEENANLAVGKHRSEGYLTNRLHSLVDMAKQPGTERLNNVRASIGF
jgi:hypothetical protein